MCACVCMFSTVALLVHIERRLRIRVWDGEASRRAGGGGGGSWRGVVR